MPCEGCNTQFTVFKRKRPCSECRRYFCNHCLTKRNQNILCERCVIFTKRPLTKADLLNLKPKDLIFYLQSKHISTTGCVEKEELVNLILTNTDVGSMPSNTRNNDNQSLSNDETDNASNPFDHLKQTCQNLFNSFTDRLSSDLGFDNKQHPTTPSTSSNSNYTFYDSSAGIITREIPTYSESLNRATTSATTATTINNNRSQERDQIRIQRPTNLVSNKRTTETYNNTNYLSPSAPNTSNDVYSSASSPSSPINSISSISSSISSQAITQEQQKQQSSDFSKSNDGENISSPGTSSLLSSQHQNRLNEVAGVHKSVSNHKLFKNLILDGNGSGCDCSDDEIIGKYNSRIRTNRKQNNQSSPPLSSSFSSSQKCGVGGEKCSPISQQSDSAFEDQIAGPSGSTAESRSNSRSLNETHNCEIKNSDGSSGSSFEELGAVGGDIGCNINDISSDNEVWQMVNKVEIPPYSNSNQRTAVDTPAPSTSCIDNVSDNNANSPFPSLSDIHSNLTDKKSNTKNNSLKQQQQHQLLQSKNNRPVTRRRSDSYIYRQKQLSLEQYEAKATVFQQLNEESDEGEHTERKQRKRVKKCCKKCGKSKKSIEGRVDRFRRHLESSELSASEIKRELSDFVQYLEQKEKSDCSDESETNHEQGTEDLNDDDSSQLGELFNEEIVNEFESVLPYSWVNLYPQTSFHSLQSEQQQSQQSQLQQQINNSSNIVYNNVNDGIHVYAPEEEVTSYQQIKQSKPNSRFINLTDFKTSSELDDLSVKQLKEILMLNRVDFKGCCEKQELLDRVKRLWKELQSCPEVEKLPVDDLCKICMDAPIECVILECGHMATCTNCGKVLSECPICRQYIVRIVRFFKA